MEGAAPTKQTRTTEQLQAMILEDMRKVDGCPKNGLNIIASWKLSQNGYSGSTTSPCKSLRRDDRRIRFVLLSVARRTGLADLLVTDTCMFRGWL
jgi:hypothetical protein